MDRRSLLKGVAAGALAAPAAALLPAGAASAAPAAFDVLVGDITSGRIMLFDRNKAFTSANVKWSLDPAGGHPMEHRFRATDGDGEILLVAAGTTTSGTASIYRRSDKQKLWSANVPNYPHCIERARGTGVVVVAGRSDGGSGGTATGGSLHVFRPQNKYSSSLVPAQTIPFHQAHGLLWDPQLDRMWAIGGSVLTAYRIETTSTSAKLVEDTARRITVTRGHDVQPDYRDTGRLLICETGGVHAVDKATMKKTQLHDRDLVKSYVQHASGEQMWTGAVADGNAFGTRYVHFNLGTTRPVETAGAVVYRARIDTTFYQ
ncbi:hypothetical protein [Streptomyces longispororuber]|uniref:hypothetical protein n=1 Tax=Streptomyces longispororuber TaxID=68230 RepID=UPI00210A6366|nr:hypothetical protein [Streptomyces longispororuber]MCQ4209641.1 hypothetical protein [Streptomyces longispororuber]